MVVFTNFFFFWKSSIVKGKKKKKNFNIFWVLQKNFKYCLAKKLPTLFWQIYSSICHTLLGAQFARVIWVNICTHYFDRSILQFCQTLLRAQFSRVIWVNVCAKFHCSRQLSHVMKKNLYRLFFCAWSF